LTELYLTSEGAAAVQKQRKVVILGGGTGISRILEGLKDSNDDITAICTGADNGGDTGNLVEEQGQAGFIGDVRKCCIALSHDEFWARVEADRYETGRRKGMVAGNDTLTHCIRVAGGDLKQALPKYWEHLKLKPNHRVLPVINKPTELCVIWDNGKVTRGEKDIAAVQKAKIQENPDHISKVEMVFLDPLVPVYPEAEQAVRDSHFCVFAPGSPVTSILPVIAPGGMPSALRDSRHKIVLILNLMFQEGENDYQPADLFVSQIEKCIGQQFDAILYSHFDKPLPGSVQDRYAEEHMAIRGVELRQDPRVVKTPLRMCTPEGMVRHDPQLVRKALGKVFRTFESVADNASFEEVGGALQNAFSRKFSTLKPEEEEPFLPLPAISQAG
jgi:uncharacterized cofD-like protein